MSDKLSAILLNASQFETHFFQGDMSKIMPPFLIWEVCLCFDNIAAHPRFVNFSGGKDSTYLLLEMIRRDLPFEGVLNVDTGMEFPAMYDHINQVDDFLWTKRRMRITRLKPEKTFEELMFTAANTSGPDGVSGYGWPNAVVRWCTFYLKTEVIRQFKKSLCCNPYHYIAFAADEKKRLERKNSQNPMHIYPLVEWGITEADALAGCYQAGYTWGGLYEHFSRVSCWCCPLQSLPELRNLRTYYPEIWTKLRDLDDRAIAQFGWETAYGNFRRNESIRMLEVRFDFEKEWAQAGGNIRSRAFYQKLRDIYQDRFDFLPAAKTSTKELLQFLTETDVSVITTSRHKKPKQKHPIR